MAPYIYKEPILVILFSCFFFLNYSKNQTLFMNEQRNILHEIRKHKANWIGHILRRNCLLKQVIEGKIKGEMEVTRRRGRRMTLRRGEDTLI
jgi:hypothetical protein